MPEVEGGGRVGHIDWSFRRASPEVRQGFTSQQQWLNINNSLSKPFLVKNGRGGGGLFSHTLFCVLH